LSNFSLFSKFLCTAVEDIHTQLPSNIALYQFNDDINLPVFNESKDLQTLISQVPRDPPPADKITKPSHHDELLYIYTSGTTGLPKAAVITHSRFIYIAAAIHKVADFWDDDVYYSPLPLYHTACGCMAVGQMLIFGSTVVIRKKFSASAFFSDCAKYKATVS
jgi:solute carrier family 27 fatty acid transporter 1/4